jgi:hypothetical protein
MVEEEEGGLGDYAGLVARAVLDETMAERTWSVPCSSSPQQGDTDRRMLLKVPSGQIGSV